MSCCAIAWSMFLSNTLSINFIHTGQRNTALPLLKKVQLNALGLIRLVITLHDDWILAFFFFRRRRRQLSHLHLSKPILKKKSRKQQNQSALSHYLQFSHWMVVELHLFFLFLFFSKNLTMYSETPHCTLLLATHVGNALIILLNHSHFDYVMFPMI